MYRQIGIHVVQEVTQAGPESTEPEGGGPVRRAGSYISSHAATCTYIHTACMYIFQGSKEEKGGTIIGLSCMLHVNKQGRNQSRRL